MTEGKPIVFVVDDDVSVRDGLRSLIRSVGLSVEVFDSGEEFLRREETDAPSCLILDVRLPGLGGLAFQEKLTSANIRIPIIFITAHGDIPMSVRAMKAGAFEFLTKPFRDQDLLEAVQLALRRDAARRVLQNELAGLKTRYQLLTSREQQLLPLIVSGRLNKEVAAEVGISEITVKVHRASIVRKMQAESREELVRMAGRLGISPS